MATTKKIRKAVIPVAGLGTRFLPASKSIPKEMIPIIDKPMIQYIVEEAIDSGLEEIIFITGRGKEAIENHFDHSYELESTLREKNKSELLEIAEGISNMVRVVSIRQKAPMGLGHAVLCAKAAIGDEPFAILLGDDLFVTDAGKRPGIGQLIDAYEKTGHSVVGLLEVEKSETDKYGIASPKDSISETDPFLISDLVEKPKPDVAPSNLALPGRYLLTPEVFTFLENTKPGAGGEIQLTDSLADLAKGPGLSGIILQGDRHDAGNKLGYLEATVQFALKRPEFKDAMLDICKRALQ